MTNSNFWDDFYKKKDESQQSWFQTYPEKSLNIIESLNLPKNSRIIDIGAGESRLVDFLLERGFESISLLDISSESLEKTNQRLGTKSAKINFIPIDITKFKAEEKFDFWHDRAAFHFLNQPDEVEKYLQVASSTLRVGGMMLISTFSSTGPEKCSGLNITRYTEQTLEKTFEKYFKKIKCFEHTHTTPWESKQDFIYCLFKKESSQDK